MIAQQPLLTRPHLTDASLVLSVLSPLSVGGVRDASPAGNDGTLHGTPTFERGGGLTLDGVSDRVDFGDIGNIQEVSMWVKPATVAEQLFQIDNTVYIHLVAGTITYNNLNEVATFVNGQPSKTLVPGEWQHVVFQFEVDDANNFELAYDGANYGALGVRDLRVRTSWSTADEVYQNAAQLMVGVLFSFNGYVYAGVCDNVANIGKIYRSGNGATWTLVYSAPAGHEAIESAFVWNHELYIPVHSWSGSDCFLAHSADGVTWTEDAPLTDERYIRAGTMFGGYMYMVVRNQDTTHRIVRTTDMSTLETVYNSTGGSWGIHAWTDGYIYCGDEDNVIRSADGTTWAIVDANYGIDNDDVPMTFATFKGKLYAGTTHHGHILSTPDGTTWTTEAVYAWNDSILDLVPMGDVLVAACYGSVVGVTNGLRGSTDGSTWNQYLDVNGAGIFCCCDHGGTLFAGARLASGATIYRCNLSRPVYDFNAGVPDGSLALHLLKHQNDLSRFAVTFGNVNGVVLGRQMEFDGITNYLPMTVADWRGSDEVGTICAWVTLDAIGAYRTIFGSCDEAADINKLLFWVTDGGLIAVQSESGGGGHNNILGSTVLGANRWYHVAVVSDGTQYLLYVNGVAETLTVSSGDNNGCWLADAANRDSVTVGVRSKNAGQDYYFNGSIKDLRYYSEAKSADWIADLYRKTRIFF